VDAGTEPKEPPMNPTPQPLAPDLSASLRHLRRIAAGGALALALLGTAAGLAGPAAAAESGAASHGTGAGGGKVSMNDLTVAGDPSQWGLTTGKDPELPSTPGVATGKDPELPVSSGLTRRVNEYEGQHR
jgi:hypothetical protein